jgi:hypothetical protein
MKSGTDFLFQTKRPLIPTWPISNFGTQVGDNLCTAVPTHRIGKVARSTIWPKSQLRTVSKWKTGKQAQPAIALAIDRNAPSLKAIVFCPEFHTVSGDPRPEDIADRLPLVFGLHLGSCFLLSPACPVSVAALG